MQTLFVSDLHLQASKPELTALAFSLFDSVARDCETMYILGDLFEYWIGDDACDLTATEIANRLTALSNHGVNIIVMHGNRDFLLGEKFVSSFGGSLVREDTIVVELNGKASLLMHGDTLCTDDNQYQFYRRMVRNSGWQSDFLAKSVTEREATANMIRNTSKVRGHRAHTENIADINEDALHAAVSDYSVERVIHGHTHRPAFHQHQIDGRAIDRLVLGDWHTDHAIVAISDEDSCRLLSWNGDQLNELTS